MSYRHVLPAFAAAVFLTLAASRASTPAPAPTMAPMSSATATPTQAPLTDAERAFVAQDSALLQGLYPTVASAKAHGYVPLSARFDASNTQIYTSLSFDGITLDHPNFLWYDRSGNLAGVDYELRKSQYRTPPHLATYPVQDSRWSSIGQHVHVAYRLRGQLRYGEGRATPALRTGHLTAAMLRRAKLLPPGATLVWASFHPAVWDLALWTVPNSNGPFADLNPAVK